MIEITASLLVFAILSFVVLVASLMVVTTRNLMHAALFLILAFFCVAGYYVILDAGFFAAAQLLIYVGAIAILFIFATMLTRGNSIETSASSQNVAFLVSGLLFAVLYVVVASPTGFIFAGVAERIGTVRWNVQPESAQATTASVDSINLLGLTIGDLNGYGSLLLLSGALLLLSLLGSVYIARERKSSERQLEREGIIAEMRAEQALADADADPQLNALPEPVHHAHEDHAPAVEAPAH